MSSIFDALQRAEGERSGSESSEPLKATELLRRAEQSAASMRNASVPLARPVTTKNDERGTKLETGVGSPPATTLGAAALTSSFRAGEGESDRFSEIKEATVSPTPESRLVCLTDSQGPAAEAFRLFVVRMEQMRRSRSLKRVLITSSIPQEGKSVVAANLACALALRTEQKVLLVEGDMRRPSFSKIFGLSETYPGLCEFLHGDRSLMASVYRLEQPGIWMLPAGSAFDNTLDLLQSGRMSTLMEEIDALFDWVIIDAPPVLPLADTSIWMRLADGILLVTRTGITEKRQLQRGLEAIDSKKLIGALLNCSSHQDHSDYYYRRSPSATEVK